MAKGNFTVFLVRGPQDRNPANIGNVSGDGEKEVLTAAIKMVKEKFPKNEVQGCGLEAVEFGGERRQYAGIIY